MPGPAPGRSGAAGSRARASVRSGPGRSRARPATGVALPGSASSSPAAERSPAGNTAARPGGSGCGALPSCRSRCRGPDRGQDRGRGPARPPARWGAGRRPARTGRGGGDEPRGRPLAGRGCWRCRADRWQAAAAIAELSSAGANGTAARRVRRPGPGGAGRPRQGGEGWGRPGRAGGGFWEVSARGFGRLRQARGLAGGETAVAGAGGSPAGGSAGPFEKKPARSSGGRWGRVSRFPRAAGKCQSWESRRAPAFCRFGPNLGALAWRSLGAWKLLLPAEPLTVVWLQRPRSFSRCCYLVLMLEEDFLPGRRHAPLIRQATRTCVG